ncbi:MAG TPA: hypothetical protein DCP92_08390 [Nitrospiraceae bacterium]|jgi:hypothetical protein|nr:hypothetical protein [Nitrospiraceae bacterium]
MGDNARKVLMTAIVALVLAAASRAAGVVYKYVDEKGTQCFTDSIHAVPERFQKKAVILQGTEERESVSPAQQERLAGRAEGVYAKIPDKSGWVGKYREIVENKDVRIAAYIAGFLLVFVAIGKAGAALGHKQLSSVIRFAMTAGLLLYLATAYLKDMASFYTEVKDSMMGIRQQANERNAEIKNAMDAPCNEPKQ